MRWLARFAGYVWAAGAVAGCTFAGWLMARRFDLVNIAMVYLLAVVVIAVRFSLGAAVTAALLAVLAFDVAFVPPRGAVTVDDAQYLLTFAIMVVVAIVISRLVADSRRQAERRAALALEAEKERIRSTLLASISHDLRTPLAVMAGASSSLAEESERMDPGERKALAQSVFEQARRLSDHVAKILQMTRIEAGAIRVERDWVALDELVGTVLARLRPALATRRVIVDLPADLPLVRVDATLIEQALANLLENAAQHTPPGTIVRVRGQREAGEVVLTVEDYGGGPEGDDLERVFARFHEGLPEGTGAGVGLGLAICRALVKLHGGRTWAERIPGGAIAFRFSLPVEDVPPIPAEPVSD
ncbi:MAG: DUF4118 domain-containing protein [Proteobacteria bacterium]|nr:DUF4118 domain-containing protein [Pseudomonadota bacterium]